MMQSAGSQPPLTLGELDTILADIARSEERRSQFRVEHRKPVLVICLGDHRATVRSDVSLGWIEDVSASGAKLLHSVSADRFWVRVLGAEYHDPFIECRVQWREGASTNAPGPSETLQSCGVQFERLLNGQEFAKVLTATNSVSLSESEPGR